MKDKQFQQEEQPRAEIREAQEERGRQLWQVRHEVEDFTTVKRPVMNELKMKYTHTQDKRFYMTAKVEHPIHFIFVDGTYSKIRTEKVYKGK